MDTPEDFPCVATLTWGDKVHVLKPLGAGCTRFLVRDAKDPWAETTAKFSVIAGNFAEGAELRVGDMVRVNWNGGGGFTVYEVRGFKNPRSQRAAKFVAIANFSQMEDGDGYERCDG